MKGRVSALPGMMNFKELGTLGATVDYVGPRPIAGLVDGMKARAKVEMWNNTTRLLARVAKKHRRTCNF